MDGTVWTLDDILYKAEAGTPADDVIFGTEGIDYLSGGHGNDHISGWKGSDILEGNHGDDSIYGDQDGDILAGGDGTDILIGWEGNDTYRFAGCSEYDLVIDHLPLPRGGVDTIEVASGILPEDVEIERATGWLFKDTYSERPYSGFKLSIRGTDDEIVVAGWLDGDDPVYGVEFIRFEEDGTVWETSHIQDLLIARATEGSDFILGFSRDDTIHGLGGTTHSLAMGAPTPMRSAPDLARTPFLIAIPHRAIWRRSSSALIRRPRM